MGDEISAKNGKRFDHLLAEKLNDPNFNGAIVLESHNRPATRQSLFHLMGAINANRVRTFSLEIGQHVVDSMCKAKSTEAWLASPDNEFNPEFDAESMCKLVRAAHQYRIKVLGHEHTELLKEYSDQFDNFLGKNFPTIAKKYIEVKKIKDIKQRYEAYGKIEDELEGELKKNLDAKKAYDALCDKYDMNSYEMMEKRNTFAANHILKNKEAGPMFVLAGGAHGRHIYITTRNEPERANDVKRAKDNKLFGLDRKLNLVAFTDNDLELQSAVGPIGATLPTADKNTHSVIFPRNLKDLRINSWPPEDSTPLQTNIPMSPTKKPEGPQK